MALQRKLQILAITSDYAHGFISGFGLLGRKPTQGELDVGKRMNGGDCNGCWVATADGGGTFISYRLAGKASEGTLSTTATVEINYKSVNNALNAGKELKLKFPMN